MAILTKTDLARLRAEPQTELIADLLDTLASTEFLVEVVLPAVEAERDLAQREARLWKAEYERLRMS